MDHLTLSNNNLDCSNGRATMIGGTLYYSPNSHHSFHGVYNLEHNDVADHFLINDILGAWLKYPVPWNESLGWLGLLPFEVLYEGPLFGRLHSFYATSWLQLHYNLHDLVQALQRLYGFNFDPPVAPENGTFDEVFTTVETAFNNLKSWRTWFSSWIALISFLVATAETIDGDEQKWCQVAELYDCGGGLGPFAIGARIGVYLDHRVPHPSVAWFCRHNIPVWYRWDPSDTVDKYPAPYPHQLQEVQIIRVVEPMLHEPQASYKTTNAPCDYQSYQPQETVGSQPPKQDTHQLSPWEFLKRWHESDIQKMAEAQNSDPAKYQKYMQRQKKPSTVAARVFVWEQDVEDFERWTHTEVSRRWHETILGDYGGATYFSPIAYEWDCCEEFGMMPGTDDPMTDDPMPDNSMPNDDGEAGEPSTTCSLTPPPFLMQDSDTLNIDLPSLRQFVTVLEGSSLEFVPSTVEGVVEEGEVEEGELQEEPVQEGKVQSINQEVLEILSMNYGFMHPILLPTKAVFPEDLRHTDNDVLNFLRVLGLWDEGHFKRSPITAICMKYIKSLSVGEVGGDTCDLSPYNHAYLGQAYRIQYIQCLKYQKHTRKGNGSMSMDEDTVQEGSLYMFDFKEHATVPWKIAVTSAQDALFIFHMDK
ncbi:hypothetical protein BDQ17DRAFT_1431826 [Cyathus striatus]|nr:hypothetical protein BDQ17DRAFT_1431826 [Cyathus striatus]